jgi:hypothetical protein
MKIFNKLPKQPKYFKYKLSLHVYTATIFIFSALSAIWYSAYFPSHTLKAGIAYCTLVPWIQFCRPFSYIHCFILFMKSDVLCINFQIMLVVFPMKNTDAFEWYSVGNLFLLITFIFMT